MTAEFGVDCATGLRKKCRSDVKIQLQTPIGAQVAPPIGQAVSKCCLLRFFLSFSAGWHFGIPLARFGILLWLFPWFWVPFWINVGSPPAYSAFKYLTCFEKKKNRACPKPDLGRYVSLVADFFSHSIQIIPPSRVFMHIFFTGSGRRIVIFTWLCRYHTSDRSRVKARMNARAWIVAYMYIYIYLPICASCLRRGYTDFLASS